MEEKPHHQKKARCRIEILQRVLFALKLSRYFSCVCVRLDLEHDFFYPALFVNNKSGAHYAHYRFAI